MLLCVWWQVEGQRGLRWHDQMWQLVGTLSEDGMLLLLTLPLPWLRLAVEVLAQMVTNLPNALCRCGKRGVPVRWHSWVSVTL